MKVRLSQKVVALAASGLVLLSGATVTSLAAWTDTEWVNGGVGTASSVSTSMFDVEQNITTNTSTNWTSGLTSPGGTVDFGTAASKLTPGTTVYGFVRLRTTAGSVGGNLTLVHGTSTGSSTFLNALTYGATLHPDPTTCNATHYADVGDPVLVADGSTIATDSATPFTLVPGTGGAAGTEQTVCFKLNFPALSNPADKTLEGLSADPVWQFNAISN